MRWFFVLLAIVLGGWLGTRLLEDSGYVMVRYADTVIESSVGFVLVVSLLGAAVLWVGARLLKTMFDQVSLLRSWRANRSAYGLSKQKNLAALALIQEDWGRAGQILGGLPGRSEGTLWPALGLALAAHRMGKLAYRDYALSKVAEKHPKYHGEIQCIRIQFLLADGNLEEVVALGEALAAKTATPANVYPLLAEAFVRLDDWARLATIWPQLEKGSLLKSETLTDKACVTMAARLMSVADPKKAITLIPRRWRKEAALFRRWVSMLVEANQVDAALDVIDTALPGIWDAHLVRLYGRLESDLGLEKRISVAKKWRSKRRDDADALHTLGRLYVLGGQPLKAKDNFELALRAAEKSGVDTGEHQAALGEVLVGLGDLERGAGLLVQARAQ